MGSSLRDERSGRWRQRILLPSAKAGHVTRPGAETAELGRTAEMRGTAEMREPAGLGEAMKAAGVPYSSRDHEKQTHAPTRLSGMQTQRASVKYQNISIPLAAAKSDPIENSGRE